MNIKRGDTVEVVSGNSKGTRGEVVRVVPGTNRLVVQGANVRKKHQKQAKTQARQGQIQPGIIQFEAPLNAANVMLVCPKCGRLARVGYQIDEADGSKRRVCRQCKQQID
jgi:large subunit ribosomal protein L24